MSKTFDLDIDNTSDHQPIIAKLDYSIPDVSHGQHCPNSTKKQKIHWSNISQETINVRYVDPLLSDVSELNIPSSIEPTALTETNHRFAFKKFSFPCFPSAILQQKA